MKISCNIVLQFYQWSPEMITIVLDSSDCQQAWYFLSGMYFLL